MVLLFIIFAPALAAVLLLLFPRGWLVRATIFVPALIFAYLLSRIGISELLYLDIPWVPSLWVTLSFFLDGLGLVFELRVSAMGTLVLLYSSVLFHTPADC